MSSWPSSCSLPRRPRWGRAAQESPYDRLIRVEKWDVTLHMVYDCSSRTRTERAVSDSTGTLRPVDP